MAKNVAKKTNLKLFEAEDQQGNLVSLGSPAPCEYVDNAEVFITRVFSPSKKYP